jgi:hypothetical protein
MAKQAINLGTQANDGTGDTLRAALDKCNDNFDEIYALTDGSGAASVLTLAAGTATLGDTTIADPTPVLVFKDSSCADADVNADIVVSATNTGSGTENVDVTFGQQVAGTKVNFLVSTAGGSLALGYSGQTVFSAKLAHGVSVVPVTTTAAPASTHTGAVYTNEGDTDGATVTLPAAAAGLQFSVVVQAAQTLTVTAGTGDTIRVAASVTAAAGSITCATVGSAITLVAINATEWVALSTVGTWTVPE